MRVLLLLAALLAPLTGQEFDSHVREMVSVPMRDGVALATDVYRPARGGVAVTGRFPVLVARSPYNKEGERSKAEFFARRGYVFVAQDCRGFFSSPGRFEPMVHEGADGFDTIAWAAAQPWSNGRVGTLGASYLALVQFAAMVERPPHLQAVYAAVGPTNYYAQGVRRGGIPGSGSQVWVLNAAARRTKDPQLRKRLEAIVEDPRQWLLLPLKDRLEVFGAMEHHREALRRQMLHSTFDDYWRRPGYWPAGYFKRMKDVPVLLAGGWYDSFASATLELHRELARLGNAPKRLLMGPWPHAYGKRECGEAEFPAPAELDERALQLAWFGRWLKDEPAEDPPTVRYFLMGGGAGRAGQGIEPGGEWRESSGWPPAGARRLELFPAADGQLARSAPRDQAAVTYQFDPGNPPPTRGGLFRNGCIVDLDAGPAREDVIHFATPPLDQPVTLAGPIEAELEVSTSARDADFIARLVDVWPDGYAMPVAEGAIRLSRLGVDGAGSSVTPGRRYRVTIALGSTALRLPAGHRLRLDISSGSFPALEPNQGTGEPVSAATKFTVAHQTVHTGGRRPTRLVLTVLPDGE